MAGSHRAESAPRAGAPVWLRAGLAMLLVVLGVWFGATRIFGDDDPVSREPDSSATTPAVPTPDPSTPAPPSASPTPTTPAAKPLPRVPADVPRRFFATGLFDVGFDDSIEPDGDRFTQLSSAELARWGSRGKPGSPGSDTVYLVGRVDGGGALSPLPRVKVGAKLRIRTDQGILTYTVRASTARAAKGIRQDASFRARVPGKLVLIGVRYDRSGDRTGRYLIVTAQLSAAQKS